MRILSAVIAGMIFGISATAQETPRVEVAGVYSAIPGLGDTCNGGGVSLTVNANRWIGGAADLDGCRSTSSSGFYGSGPTLRLTNTQYTYLFGPRFTYRSTGRINPSVHVLFGGAYSRLDSFTVPDSKVFAMSIGMGLNVRLNTSVAVLAQPEYVRTHFSGWSDNYFRLRTGFVFRLGTR